MESRATSMVARHKHELIAADILNHIRSGEWKKGTKVPSVKALESVYPCSYMTIFKALQNLTRRGYLRTVRGVGTFVARDRLGTGVGLIVSEDLLHPQATPWPFLLMQGLRAFFARHDYVLKIYLEMPDSPNDEIPVQGLLEDVRRERLAGVILANCNASQYLGQSKTWRQSNLPLVDITDWTEASHRVTFDRRALIRLALHHFQVNKRQRVGGIAVGDRDYFLAQAKACGMKTRSAWMADPVEGDDWEKQGCQMMTALWKQAQKPDALLVGDDVIAKGVLQAVMQLGIAVPDDLLVASHANRNSGIFNPVPIVRLEYDIEECAQVAGGMLLDLIRNPNLPPHNTFLQPRLVLENTPASSSLFL